jgi:hypothetical protein
MLGAQAEIYIFAIAKLLPTFWPAFLADLHRFCPSRFHRSMRGREESLAETDSRIGDASGDPIETRKTASRVPSPYSTEGE